MTNSLFHKSNITKLLIGLDCLSIPVLILIFTFLLVPSIRPFLFSRGLWDGFFPSGEYHIKITNQANEPVEGAILNVFEGGTQKPAFEYPIDNYVSDNDLKSNELGLIIALHRPRGFEFGGTCWAFLVFIQKCTDGPRYDFEITADGYKTVKYSEAILYIPVYSNMDNATTSVILDNGQEAELPIFEINIVLKK